MSRNDFLDILRDYLTNHFSESEIEDILRDYEEFFLNGQLEGKSEDEIANSLGSPKQVANELISEVKFKGESNNNNYAKESSETIKKKAGIYYNRVKEETKKVIKSEKVQGAKDKAKGFLNAEDIVNGNVSSWVVKTIVILLTMMLILPTIAIVFGLIISALGFIATFMGNIASYFIGILFLPVNGPIGVLIIFGSIFLTGLIIIGLTVYFNIIKFGQILFIKYRSWVKRKLMYVKVRKNHEYDEKHSEILLLENKYNKGGDSDEEN